MDYESRSNLKEKKCILYLEKTLYIYIYPALSLLVLYLSMEFKGEL